MRFTTTTTSKGQLTIPKAVREKLGIKTGTKIDIFPASDGSFIGKPKRKSNLMKFAGSMSHLDDGKSWKEIREETQKVGAHELVSKYIKLVHK